jgi:hypothetical protein
MNLRQFIDKFPVENDSPFAERRHKPRQAADGDLQPIGPMVFPQVPETTVLLEENWRFT